MLNSSIISVIVPVYNSQKSLLQCVSSILSQSYRDFELIIIDDGSKDNSGKICDSYILQDDRVRVIHKENGGVSSARNVGISNARGKRIVFIDSDDWVRPDYLASFELEHCADFVISSFVYSGGVKGPTLENVYYGDSNMKDFINWYVNSSSSTYSPWSKMYDTELMRSNNLFFNEGISYGEDLDFNLRYLLYCKSAASINKFSYVYKFDENINFYEKYSLTVDKLFYSIDSLSRSMAEFIGMYHFENHFFSIFIPLLSIFPVKTIAENDNSYFDYFKKVDPFISRVTYLSSPYGPIMRILCELKDLTKKSNFLFYRNVLCSTYKKERFSYSKFSCTDCVLLFFVFVLNENIAYFIFRIYGIFKFCKRNFSK